MYVLFEGIDTSGKSTQIELLRRSHPDMIATYEPGATKLGQQIRKILLDSPEPISSRAEAFLFLADRAEHYDKLIAPNKDKLVVSDRGFISGLAYAMANDKSADLEQLLAMNRWALDAHLPDKVVLMRTNEKLLRERLGAKKHDKIESRGISYLLGVQDNMLTVIEHLALPHLVLDAAETITNLHDKIKGFLDD
jgi:dTMP kinase